MTEISKDPGGVTPLKIHTKTPDPHDPTNNGVEYDPNDPRQIGDIADVQKLLKEKKEDEQQSSSYKDPTKNFYGPGHSKDTDDLMRESD